jgi:hypothetical protein
MIGGLLLALLLGAPPPDAEGLLTHALRASVEANFRGLVTIVRSGSDDGQAATLSVVQSNGRRWLAQVVPRAPAAAPVAATLARDDADGLAALVLSNYAVSLQGDGDSVAGRGTWRLSLAPRAADKDLWELAVDRASGLILAADRLRRLEPFSPPVMVAHAAFESLSMADPTPLPDPSEAVAPPPDGLPPQLPLGYQRLPLDPPAYTDGWSVLTVSRDGPTADEPLPALPDGPRQRLNGRMVALLDHPTAPAIAWRLGRERWTLVGDQDLTVLRQVASGLVPRQRLGLLSERRPRGWALLGLAAFCLIVARVLHRHP